MAEEDSGVQEIVTTKRKGKHNKSKPWDDDTIDHWRVDKFDPSWNPDGMLSTSEFKVLFPQYREAYCKKHDLRLRLYSRTMEFPASSTW